VPQQETHLYPIMNHSSSMSYTHMLNSSITSHDPQNTSSQPPIMDPSQFHMNHLPVSSKPATIQSLPC
jgi:hypothetical protein